MMKLLIIVILVLIVVAPAQAGPWHWITHHKRFIAMESAAIGGALVHAKGLHDCRLNGVERCDEHYGSAWGAYAAATIMTTMVMPATAEASWKSHHNALGYTFAYGGSAIQAGWGVHEETIPSKPDLSTARFAH